MTSQEFKVIRNELGLSQSQLASIMGLAGKQAVSAIESGRRMPTKIHAAFIHFILLVRKNKIYTEMTQSTK